jgi:hypothetical protein
MDKRKSKCSGYGMFTGIYWIIALGVVLGILIGIPIRNIEGWQNSPSELAALLVAGIGLAYILLSALDWATQLRALASNPLPDELDLSERAVASERLGTVKGCTILHRHIRRLLSAWAAGASGPQVAAMASSQMHRILGTLVAETAAVLALLAATAGFMPPQLLLTLTTGLMVLLILVAVARIQLASHLAGYIESNLLARIGNDTPAAAGLEFAQAVGKSVADSTASLAAAQAKFADQLAKAQQEGTAQLVKAHSDAAAQITKAQQEASAQLSKAQAEASAQVSKAQSDAAAQIAKAQQEGTAQLAKAQDQVAEQLGRVTDIAASVDGIFKLQQAVDGAIKGVAVTDEFKSTLVALKQHLAESDELLKNAAKPRTIRLVEKDNE